MEEKTIEDLRKAIPGWNDYPALGAYLNLEDSAEGMPASEVLQEITSTPAAMDELREAAPQFYTKLKVAEASGKGWDIIWDPPELTLDNLAKSLGLSTSDLATDSKAFQAYSGADLKSLWERQNGWKFADALKLVEEAQSKQGRVQAWEDASAVDRIFSTLAAPNTSETLAAGEPVDGIKASDIGLAVASAVPVVKAGQFIRALGNPVVRGAGQVIVGPLGEAIGGIIDQESPSTIAKRAGLGIRDNAGIAAILKGGPKLAGQLIPGLEAMQSKAGQEVLSSGEALAREGLYKVDIERRIADLETKRKARIPWSQSEIDQYRTYKALKELSDEGIDVGTLGKFDQAKFESYMQKVKADPEVSKRRAQVAATYEADPVDAFIFENNAGIVRLQDILETVRGKNPTLTAKSGYAPRAGFGKANASSPGTANPHPGLPSGSRKSYSELLDEAKQKVDPNTGKLRPHRDPYYSHSSEDLDKAEDLIARYPEFVEVLKKAHKDPAFRDWMMLGIVPNNLRTGWVGTAWDELTTDKESDDEKSR